MNDILNAQEAFTAMLAGKNVLARCNVNMYGRTLDEDFAPISDYSADIFKESNMEYCIKIETMELASITFAKPLVPEDIRDQQEIYIVMPTCILRTKYDAEHTDVHNAVMNGFAQADAENAIAHNKVIIEGAEP